MTTKHEPIAERDAVLYVGDLRSGTIEEIAEYNKTASKKLKILLAIDKYKIKKARTLRKKYERTDVEVFSCNFRSPVQTRKDLQPYADRILAISAADESRIPYLKSVIPHVPYIGTPTPESLDWSTDKILMRKMIEAHDPSLTPRFLIAEEASVEVIERVGKRIGYPVIVKPAGLAGSKLVSMCYHEEELQHVLKRTFRKLQKAYDKYEGRGEPQVIVEQALEGALYSVDGYVNSKGQTTLLQPVHVKTGKEIGFDDFFGYRQMTPTLLNKDSINGAHEATRQTIKALGLRSTTVHCELFRTEQGWKIIELGPRMGGFRDVLYRLSYDIPHIVNDVLIRADMKPIVSKKSIATTAYMKFYAEEEGIFMKLSGIAAVKKLESFVSVDVDREIGDELNYAKNGGHVVVKLVLSHADRSSLLADIRRAEQAIIIETRPTHVLRKQIQETADALLQPIEDVEFKGKKAAKKVKDRIKKDLQL